MRSRRSDSNREPRPFKSSRRGFLKQAGLVVAGTHATAILPRRFEYINAAALPRNEKPDAVIADTTYGKVRGTSVQGIKIFKAIPYGGTTAGKNRFMPPTKPLPWTGVRDALDYGPSAPQRNPNDPDAGARAASVPLIGNLSDRPESEDCLVLIFTDFRYGTFTKKLAERKAAMRKAPAYLYNFAWETPVMGRKLKSPHALEIAFVFDNTDRSARYTGGGPEAKALADKMSDSWIAFARTGNPNTPKLPRWPPYNPTDRPTMTFSNQSKVENDPGREQRLVMERVLKLT